MSGIDTTKFTENGHPIDQARLPYVLGEVKRLLEADKVAGSEIEAISPEGIEEFEIQSHFSDGAIPRASMERFKIKVAGILFTGDINQGRRWTFTRNGQKIN